MATDIATRVYNHTFRIDPAIRTLLDTDFYKLLMLQMIWKMHPKRQVTFQLINRTTSVRLADIVDERELTDQLDHARTLRLAKNELIWLAGNTFYGTRQIFEPAFMEWLATFQLPEYELTRRDGQYELRFAGPWTGTTMWEIPALAIINELRARAAMRGMSRFDLDVLYARAKAKLWSKVERLRVLEREGPVRVSDFGTRRRHGFLWQRWCVEAMQEGLGDSFIGTSNVKHAMDTGLEAIGTNAHELPMVYAAIANDDEELLEAPYKVLKDWAKMYGGNLLVVLPDCFGTTAFLRNAPDWVADWKGARPDSKLPIAGARELIEWWKQRGRDPREKLIVLSDAMDVDSIEESVRALRGQVNLSFGWGTNLTNDFVGCAPAGVDGQLKAISLVCKVVEADGRPAVKLSDNPNKVLGPPDEVERYQSHLSGLSRGIRGRSWPVGIQLLGPTKHRHILRRSCPTSPFRASTRRSWRAATAIVERLAAILPPECLIADESGRRAFETDALTAYRRLPLAVALPRSTEEVARVMRLCRDEKVNVVPRGAGTSLSGGAIPQEDAVVVALTKMSRILEVNLADRYARVEAGVTNLAISEAVGPEGFFYAPDPSSQLACTIGGNIAMNSGGAHCLKYGVTTNNLLGVRLVTLDGEILDIGGEAMDAPGYDLLGLVCGSEGQLGIVTEAIVRLIPLPEGARPVLFGFDSVEDASQCVAAIIGAGIVPVAMEYMDKPAIHICENFAHAGYPLDVEAMLIIEVEGSDAEMGAMLGQDRRDRESA